MDGTMKRILVYLLAAWVNLILVTAGVAAAQERIAGIYSGRYQCGGWNAVELQISDNGNRSLTGVFTFTAKGARSKSSYRLSGWYNNRNGRFRLDPRSWIGAAPPGYVMVGLEGNFDPTSRKLSGRITYWSCGRFELTSSETGREAARQGRRRPPSPPPLVGARSVPPRYAPPERRRYPTSVTGNTSYWFEYVDSSIDEPEGTIREEEPIDAVIDWLRENGFSCIDSQHVTWHGKTGEARDRVSVLERYAIECSGNCKGVRYRPQASAIIVHFGQSQPAPVVQIKSVWLGGADVVWHFTRKKGGQPPYITIHRWTAGKFNSGQGCEAPKVFGARP